jgi:1-pyrroline-5-carboxylate dehydrogenase
MAAEGDEVHAAFDAGLAELQPLLGQRHGSVISGHERLTGPEVVERSPVDTDVLVGRFVEATAADVAEASASPRLRPDLGRHAVARSHSATGGWADLISERRNVISALLTVEVGKNRLESLGDVEETADLIRYYTHQLADHDGFEQPMGRLNRPRPRPTSCAPTACGRSWPRSTSRPRSPAGRPARRWRPATRSS